MVLLGIYGARHREVIKSRPAPQRQGFVDRIPRPASGGRGILART